MSFLDNIFEIDRSEGTVFSYPIEVEETIAKEAKEFERKQIIAEHEAIEAARTLILTD
ncbi:MAG: hypothetical protein K2N28_04240 [Muribaculaceae bacterium]|nr:hypothetical protein [Muribaculaceae bacterium]